MWFISEELPNLIGSFMKKIDLFEMACALRYTHSEPSSCESQGSLQKRPRMRGGIGGKSRRRYVKFVFGWYIEKITLFCFGKNHHKLK